MDRNVVTVIQTIIDFTESHETAQPGRERLKVLISKGNILYSSPEQLDHLWHYAADIMNECFAPHMQFKWADDVRMIFSGQIEHKTEKVYGTK